MNRFKIVIFLTCCLLLNITFYIGAQHDFLIISTRVKLVPADLTIPIAVVACAQSIHEALTMIKSAILFNVNGLQLSFIIIAEQNLHSGFNEKLTDWQEILPTKFTFSILQSQFPEKNTVEWESMLRPCASQRLFLPSLLQNIDSVLYMDADTVFLSPVTEIWEHFKKFNSSQIAALSPEHLDKNSGWYNRFARHPFYGELGLNSGVMLMNLTRMRQFQWEENISVIYDKYKLKISYGDQDLINILFFFHPDKLYLLPCEYNYRSDFCDKNLTSCSSNGIQILHGNRRYFHVGKRETFSSVYNSIRSFELGKNSFRDFLLNLDSELSLVKRDAQCGKIKDIILMKSNKILINSSKHSSSK